MTIDPLLRKWVGKEKAGERAEYQYYLTELMQALGVPKPGEDDVPDADYKFEAPAASKAVFGNKHKKRIDLYRRGRFILKAKQSGPGAAEAQDQAPPTAHVETPYDLLGATRLFLMRTLFCMFAEDVRLRAKDSLKRFLADTRNRARGVDEPGDVARTGRLPSAFRA